MLTRNFWKIFSRLIGRYANNSLDISLINLSGTADTVTPFSSTSKPYTMLGSVCRPRTDSFGTTYGAYYGRGSTPATLDDHTMEDPILDTSLTMTGGSNSLTVAVNQDHLRISGVHQITNTTDEDIVLREVGCVIQFSAGGICYLLDRTVFEEPLVVPAGDTISTEYVIKFPYET